jgi:hypothetical protein
LTLARGQIGDATLTRTTLATALGETQALSAPGPLRRAAVVAGTLFSAMAVVLCIPFAILAIGIPIALCVRLLLWLSGLP